MCKVKQALSKCKLQQKNIRDNCCCQSLWQHSCGCWMKKVRSAVSGTAFSPAASMIALVPLHKASLSFPKRRSSVGLGKNSSATLFPSPPPLPPPQPCPFCSLCEGFALLHHTFSTVAHPDFPHLVVVSFHCLTHPYFPYFLLSSPPPLPLSAPPPLLPFFLWCCQELFSVEFCMCFSPFSHPTHSQTALLIPQNSSS